MDFLDFCLGFPIAVIAALALWAIVVKMINDKDGRDDDDLPPTGGVSATDALLVANATTMLTNA
jgi:hypothetical protein